MVVFLGSPGPGRSVLRLYTPHSHSHSRARRATCDSTPQSPPWSLPRSLPRARYRSATCTRILLTAVPAWLVHLKRPMRSPRRPRSQLARRRRVRTHAPHAPEHLRAVAAPVERARRARRPRRRHFRRSTGRIRLLGRAPPLEPRDLARAARAPERAARSRAAQAARRDAAASSCASSAPSAPNSSPSLTMPSPLRPPARLLCPVDGAPSAAATHASRRRALRVLTPRGTPPDRRSGRDTRRFVPRRCPTGRTRAIKNTRHCSAASAAAALSLAHAAPSLSAGATRVHMTHNSAGTRGSRNTTGLTPPPPKSRGMAVGGRGRAHIVPIIRDRPHHETHPNEQGEHASERRRPDPDSPKRVAPNGATRPTPTDNTSER